jgi:hypothetical protein
VAITDGNTTGEGFHQFGGCTSSNEGPIPRPKLAGPHGAAVDAIASVEGLVQFKRAARLRSLTEVLVAVAYAAPGSNHPCPSRRKASELHQSEAAGVRRLLVIGRSGVLT